tara:strand:- start:486 stop:1145 length:660 start_codon:yes stop_codon:yes gene_type:complete
MPLINKNPVTFKNTGNSTVKTYMSMVADQTSSGYGGRGIATPTIANVEQLMRDAIDSIVSDVKAINATALSTYEFATNASNANTHIDDLFPPNFANYIKNTPHADDVIVVNYIDPKIIEHYNWAQIGGSDIKAVYIRYNKIYTVPTSEHGAWAKAYWQYGSAINKNSMYEEGTCSSGSHLTASACTNAGHTWTSTHGVTLAEVTEMNNKYSSNITTLAT